MSKDYSVPQVGIGVMIFKDGKILLGKRKGSHGEGEFAFPGGYLELMESYADCGRREVAEECGIQIKNIRFLYTMNVRDFAPKHFVHVGLLADWDGGEPENLEPDKCEGWDWYALDVLPHPLFVTCRMAVDVYQSGGSTCIDLDGAVL